MKTHRTILAAFSILLAAFSFNASAQISAPAPGGNPELPVGGPGPIISGSGLNGPAVTNPAPQAPAGIPVGGPGPVIGGSGLNGPAINPPADQPMPPAPAQAAPAPVPGPGLLVPLDNNVPLDNPNWQNSGVINVVGCGYDAQGVWQTIPMRVAYTYNGVNYDVNVLAAWNPWTDSWNNDVDVPAFNTTYFLNGTTYNFYTNLSTGTFYFNL